MKTTYTVTLELDVDRAEYDSPADWVWSAIFDLPDRDDVRLLTVEVKR